MTSHSPDRVRILKIVACIVWILAMTILTVRSSSGQRHSNAYTNLQQAGLHWIQGEALYVDWRGFVYSPVVAVGFAPFARIPSGVGLAAWQLLNAASLMGGFVALIHTIFPSSFRRYSGGAALLLIPLALGNLDVGQSNALLAGVIMGSIAAARLKRWGFAAILVAVATSLKIYPLSIGLLILTVAPWRFGWRLLAALLAVFVAPFLFQHWPYVFGQYHLWISTRCADDRLNYPFELAPLDAWFLLHWIGHLGLPHFLYTLLQIGCGGLIALLCVWGNRMRWSANRLFNSIFCLGSVWMTLLGPSTESYTYLLLSPAIVLVLINSFVEVRPLWLRGCALAAFILQLGSVARSSLLPHYNPVWTLTLQPVSALFFLAACLGWLLKDAYWPAHTGPTIPGAPGGPAPVLPGAAQ